MDMKRTGFTLIELLVVVAILATLAALMAAGVMRVRDGQRATASRQTVTMLEQKLQTRVLATIERARSAKNQYRNQALILCNGDPDLADALLCYAHLKVEFPESFLQANQGFPMLGMPPSPRFKQIPMTTAIPANDQAAVLLFFILSEEAGGMAEDVVVDEATGYKFFRNSLGKPILFERWHQNLPLTNQPPVCVTKGPFKDPLDQFGKLSTWSGLPALRTQADCPQAGDNNNKLITIMTVMPTGEVVCGYQSHRYN